MYIVDLKEFYSSPLGRLVRRLLGARLRALLPSLKGETLAALGYGTPFLRPFLQGGETVIALMPEGQGGSYWPREGENVACLASMGRLPLADESVARILIVHGLELAPDPYSLLQEAWRVLKSGGQAIVIVPSRRGLWALSDQTPFGTGQPYSSSQLRGLLRAQGFCIEKLGHALFMPPWSSCLSLLVAPWIERLAALFLWGFGGVLIVQASKNVLSPLLTKSRPIQRRLVLPLSMPVSPLPTGRKAIR